MRASLSAGEVSEQDHGWQSTSYCIVWALIPPDKNLSNMQQAQQTIDGDAMTHASTREGAVYLGIPAGIDTTATSPLAVALQPYQALPAIMPIHSQARSSCRRSSDKESRYSHRMLLPTWLSSNLSLFGCRLSTA